MRYRPAVAAVLTLVVAGCTHEDRLADQEAALERQIAAAGEQIRAFERAIADAVRWHLASFRAAPPGSCTSPNLALAAMAASSLATVEGTGRVTARGVAFDDDRFATGLLLDIAAAAADRGCPEVARILYRSAIASSAGLGVPA